jgi:uridine phosphorylase
MMRWFDPLDKSRLVISPEDFLRDRGFDGSVKIPPDLIMFHTGSAIPYIKEKYALKEYPFRVPGFLSNPPIYRFRDHESIALIQGGYGAPAAVCLLEAIVTLGCRRLLAFGLGGGVGENLRLGDLVLPSEIVREEGTSFHYVPHDGNARPDPLLLSNLRDFLRRVDGLTLYEGSTVSTDAAFRQTADKELRWREEGILAVEMEMSALLAVAEYHRVPAVALLVISDIHDLEGNTPWTWDEAGMRAGRGRAIDLMIEFALGLADESE